MANPKNKWERPAAPPAPMFFGEKERNLVKQINDELAERVIGQPIAYYPISIKDSNFNDTYGEAVEKVSLPPIRVYAFVEVENEQNNDRYGYEYQTKLTVNFNRRRLVEDQDLYVRVGDFVQYGDLFYEIVRTYNDTRFYFGQVEHKFQISAECVRAREGAFRVTPALTRPTERATVAGEGTAPAPRAAPYPPLAATYITVTNDTQLPNERKLAAGTGITLTDGGAGGSLTIAASGQNAVGPTGSLQFQVGAGSFSGSANVVFLTGSSALNVSGTVSSSVGVQTGILSASAFNLVPTSGSMGGPASYLALDANNNFIVTSSAASVGGDGIFTTINGSQAYVTSSLAIGGTSAPDHQVSVSGSVSASVNISASAFYGDGSNLSGITTSPAGATTQIQFNSAGSFAGSSNLTFNGTTLTGSYTGSVGELTTLSASLMNLVPTSGSMGGPGSYLALDANNNFIVTSSTGGGVGGIFTTINGSQAYVTSSLAIGGTSAPDHEVSVSGSMSASVNISASAFYGDGSNLSGITTSAAGATTQLQYNSAGAFAGSANLTFNGTTLTGSYTGSLAEVSTLSASAVNLSVASGTLAGPGSYLSLDVNNNVVLSPGDGATTSPGGANTQIQFNNAGAFGGSSNLTFDGSNFAVVGTVSGSSTLQVVGAATLGSTLTVSGAISGASSVDASSAAFDSMELMGGDFATNRILYMSSNDVTSNAGLTFDGSNFGVVGTMSGSSTLEVVGAAILGSTLTVSGAISSSAAVDGDTAAFNSMELLGSDFSNNQILYMNSNDVISNAGLAFDGSVFNVTGRITASSTVSASSYHGGGDALTGLTIGAAEDSSYADGLFTDFAVTTPVGTAVDRFNEILKALSPGPAPNLDDIDCNDSGASAELSFGSSQSISGYTNVGTDAGFSAVDINGTYSTSTSSNNLRRGTFNGSTVINGDLNEDVSADGVNYPANSFGDADLGNLVLEVNGSTLHTASMTDPAVGTGVPGSGTGTQLNGNGSGFYDLSQTGSAEFTDGTELDLFQHRTGKYKVVAADQREGWNYLRVVHTSSTFDRTTNFVAWVNDSNSNALAASNSALDTLSMSGDTRISGVKYHTAGTAQYRTDVSNAYRNVYTSTNISYTVTNGSIPSQAMPSISVGSEDETKILQLTGSLTIDTTSILDSSIAAGVNVAHPLKSNLSNGGSQSISGILAYNRANTSTTTSETFRREDYRVISGSLSSYAAQTDVTSSSNAWNSTSSLLTNDGLLYYNQRLYSPIDSDIPNSGDFSAVSNGPSSNVDYSGISGVRTLFRYFTNTGAASQTNFELTFTGDSSTRIVPATTALSSTNIHVFVKLPTTSTGKATGWLDLGSATASDPAQLGDFDGAYVGTPPAGGLEINSDTHEGTFVTQTVEQNENIVIKIVADAAWTGYISALSISWGSS
tara:strand:- start:27635 stop:31894 length:4260 start_codon:yes stop_codon:yes gene_type:complete